MNVCQAFSLLRASKAVGIKAKHNVITSNASQQTCSSSKSGSLPALVCKIILENKLLKDSFKEKPYVTWKSKGRFLIRGWGTERTRKGGGREETTKNKFCLQSEIKKSNAL